MNNYLMMNFIFEFSEVVFKKNKIPILKDRK